MPPSIKPRASSTTKTQSQTTTSLQLILAVALLAISGSAAFITMPTLTIPTKFSCRDTDGGNKPEAFGKIIIVSKLNKTSKTVSEDSCISEKVISEAICDPKVKSGHSKVVTKCSNGACQKGICVPDKASPLMPATSFIFLKHPSSTSIGVLPGTTNVTLGNFMTRSTGADVILGEIGLSFVVNKPNLLSGNFTVKLNGSTITSSAITKINNSGTQLTILSLTPKTLAIGDNVITVEASIGSAAANGGVIITNLDITKLQRNGPGQMFYDPGVQTVSSDLVTVQSGALQVSNLPFSEQTIVVGASNATLAVIELNAGAVSSGEDVKVTKLIVNDKLVGSANFANVGNLVFYDQTGRSLATTANTAVVGEANTFTFINPLLVPKTGSLILTLKGDALDSSGGTHTFSIATQSNATAHENSTGNSILPTLGAGTGQAVTISAGGGLDITAFGNTGNSPYIFQIITAGQTNVPLASFIFSAQSEPIKLTSLKLTAAGKKINQNDIVNIRLYRNNETTPFAVSNQFQQSSTNTLTFTWVATDNILPSPIDPSTPITITVKADVSSLGTVVLGDDIHLGIANANDVTGKGATSGNVVHGKTVDSIRIAHIAPFSVFATANDPTANSSITRAVVRGSPLARIKIANNGSSKITMTGIKFIDNGSHTGNSTAYDLLFSDQNTNNFVAVSSSVENLDFKNMSIGIDGGAYVYLTVSIASLGGAASEDVWQMGVASLGHITYITSEADLGYDANGSGTISGNSATIYADGIPTLGTVIKQ